MLPYRELLMWRYWEFMGLGARWGTELWQQYGKPVCQKANGVCVAHWTLFNIHWSHHHRHSEIIISSFLGELVSRGHMNQYMELLQQVSWWSDALPDIS
jgi:hypothetical protein